MEVHAHSHTPRKKWTHYLWEFLMLFLAVFCGFLAENQREHIVEHKREKKFARRLLSDLREDAAFFQKRIHQLKERKKEYEEFLTIMTSASKPTDSEILLSFIPLTRGYNPEVITATYNEMKSSGSLRYIGNDNLTTVLQKYYEVLLPKTDREADDIKKFFIDYIAPYMTKHFRFQDLNVDDDSLKKIKHVILDRTSQTDQELINLMGVYTSGCETLSDLFLADNHQNSYIIDLIRKEYHIK